MKKITLMILSTAATFCGSTPIFGQAYFIYQNSSTSDVLLFNYDTATSTKMFGSAGTFDFGLYMGSAGSTSLSQMQLVDLAMSPNAAASTSFDAGLFNGGTVYSPGNVPNTINFQGGTQYAFLVAGWSASAGSTYNQALAVSGDPGVFLGISDLGFITPAIVPSPAPNLFGTSAGQLLGFTLYGTPEPATIALSGLGAAALLLFRRGKSLKIRM